jgi:hypothetical protein
VGVVEQNLCSSVQILWQKVFLCASLRSSVVQGFGFHSGILAGKDVGQNSTKLLRGLSAEGCVLRAIQ